MEISLLFSILLAEDDNFSARELASLVAAKVKPHNDLVF